jgi:hypothetical protein
MSAAVNKSPAISRLFEFSGKLHSSNPPIYSMLVFPKIRRGHLQSAPVPPGQ